MIKHIPQDVLQAIAEDAFDTDEKLKLMSAVQDVVGRDYTDGIPFQAVIELAKPMPPTTRVTTAAPGRKPSGWPRTNT